MLISPLFFSLSLASISPFLSHAIGVVDLIGYCIFFMRRSLFSVEPSMKPSSVQLSEQKPVDFYSASYEHWLGFCLRHKDG